MRIWEINPTQSTAVKAEGDQLAIEESARILRGHTNAVFCVAWNPRGDLVASGGMDETVRVWDVQRGPSSTSSAVVVSC